VARAKQYEPGEVVEQALEVFWRQGYGATSIDDLANVSGLSRSSLYGAFGSKRGLFSAVVDRYLADFTVHIEQLSKGGLDAVVAYFEQLADGYFRRGCLMVNGIAELAPSDADFMHDVDRYRTMIQESFLTALEIAEADKQIDPGTAVARSLLLATQLLGLFVELRTKPVPSDFAASVSSVVAGVESWRILSFEERLRRRRVAGH